ncbi:hypothetical protein FRB90_007696, partial [Tulasnella sp. 427]
MSQRRWLWSGRLKTLQHANGLDPLSGGARGGSESGGSLSEAEEEAARSAILDRALKMKQPLELPLR